MALVTRRWTVAGYALAMLTAAEIGLEHLLSYYLPLLEAREHAYNAYRNWHLGKTAQTEADSRKAATSFQAPATRLNFLLVKRGPVLAE